MVFRENIDSYRTKPGFKTNKQTKKTQTKKAHSTEPQTKNLTQHFSETKQI